MPIMIVAIILICKRGWMLQWHVAWSIPFSCGPSLSYASPIHKPTKKSHPNTTSPHSNMNKQQNGNSTDIVNHSHIKMKKRADDTIARSIHSCSSPKSNYDLPTQSPKMNSQPNTTIPQSNTNEKLNKMSVGNDNYKHIKTKKRADATVVWSMNSSSGHIWNYHASPTHSPKMISKPITNIPYNIMNEKLNGMPSDNINHDHFKMKKKKNVTAAHLIPSSPDPNLSGALPVHSQTTNSRTNTTIPHNNNMNKQPIETPSDKMNYNHSKVRKLTDATVVLSRSSSCCGPNSRCLASSQPKNKFTSQHHHLSQHHQ